MPPIRENELPIIQRTFVDREEPLHVFERAVFALSNASSHVLVYFGPSGEGKTALARELWRRSSPAVDPAYEFLLRANLDLNARQGDDQDLLLVSIRNALVDSGMDMPGFDLALALVWDEIRGAQPQPRLKKPWLGRTTEAARGVGDDLVDDVKDWLRSSGPTEILGEIAASIPGAGFLIKRIGGWVVQKAKRSYILRTRKAVLTLFEEGGELKPACELSRLLPLIFAQDINQYLEAHPDRRICIFLDEYEKLFDEGGAGSRFKKSPLDDCIKRIVQHTNGLLAVIFSREPIRWDDDPAWKADLQDNQHAIGGLPVEAAHQFLASIPIADPKLRQTIVDNSMESNSADCKVYPLILDLMVEHWRNIKAANLAISPADFCLHSKTFDARRREIVSRVLRDYGLPFQYTIERLATVSWFDKETFEFVVKRFGTALPIDAFEVVTGLSFVSTLHRDFFTMHAAIRSAIVESSNVEQKRETKLAIFDHCLSRIASLSDRKITNLDEMLFGEAARLKRSEEIESYVPWFDTAQEPFAVQDRASALARWWRESLDEVQLRLGPQHPHTAICLMNLADYIGELGDLDESVAMARRAVQILDAHSDSEGDELASACNSLAAALLAIGKFDESRSYFERALDISASPKQGGSRKRAIYLNNLAMAYVKQGKYGPARQTAEQAIEMLESLNAPESDFASALNTLAWIMQDQGDYEQAKPILRRTLAICESEFGLASVNVSKALMNLSDCCRVSGGLEEAEPLMKRAFDIVEGVYGSTHWQAGVILDNLGVLARSRGNLANAKEIHERARSIIEDALGPASLDLATCIVNLAIVSEDEGNWEDARVLLERALEIRRNVLGADHIESASTLQLLSTVYHQLGSFDKAILYLRGALRIATRSLGAHHPTVVRYSGLLHHLSQAVDSRSATSRSAQTPYNVFARPPADRN